MSEEIVGWKPAVSKKERDSVLGVAAIQHVTDGRILVLVIKGRKNGIRIDTVLHKVGRHDILLIESLRGCAVHGEGFRVIRVVKHAETGPINGGENIFILISGRSEVAVEGNEKVADDIGPEFFDLLAIRGGRGRIRATVKEFVKFPGKDISLPEEKKLQQVFDGKLAFARKVYARALTAEFRMGGDPMEIGEKQLFDTIWRIQDCTSLRLVDGHTPQRKRRISGYRLSRDAPHNLFYLSSDFLYFIEIFWYNFLALPFIVA